MILNRQRVIWLTVIIGGLALLIAAATIHFRNEQQRLGKARALRSLTGVHARITWCRQVTGSGSDTMAMGPDFILMGLDTKDRRGEREILRSKGSYHKPMITPCGKRIVFTDVVSNSIFCVNWDGSSLTELAPGRAASVWMDPATKIQWVYAFPPEAMKNESNSEFMVRFRLDNPSIREAAWNATPVISHNIQFTADGRFMSGLYPWPRAGMADLSTGEVSERGQGCWTSMSPDNSRTMWVFDDAHRNVTMYSGDGNRTWTVNINSAPGIDGYEVYHPRWSNHVRFMCMSGPYKKGHGDNRIRAGGPSVEIYIGRFNEDLASIESWLRLTQNEMADFFPDLWLAGSK